MEEKALGRSHSSGALLVSAFTLLPGTTSRRKETLFPFRVGYNE